LKNSFCRSTLLHFFHRCLGSGFDWNIFIPYMYLRNCREKTESNWTNSRKKSSGSCGSSNSYFSRNTGER